MVVIYIAYTEKVNPAGATPVMTRQQIWKGLQRKIRRAQDFVPVIESTDVLEDKGNEVLRVAHFKGQDGKPGQHVKELCKSYYPVKVDFQQPNGALITNAISDGEGLTEHDYFMTYTFEWRFPEVAEGSDEHNNLAKKNTEMAKMAVHSSIVEMRKLAARGELD